jgi:hypothetical protein
MEIKMGNKIIVIDLTVSEKMANTDANTVQSGTFGRDQDGVLWVAQKSIWDDGLAWALPSVDSNIDTNPITRLEALGRRMAMKESTLALREGAMDLAGWVILMLVEKIERHQQALQYVPPTWLLTNAEWAAAEAESLITTPA